MVSSFVKYTVNSRVNAPGAVITFHEIPHDLKTTKHAQIRGGGVAQKGALTLEFTVPQIVLYPKSSFIAHHDS